MTRLSTWFLYVTISGCASAPSSTKLYAADGNHQNSKASNELVAIEHIESDLSSIQAALSETGKSSENSELDSALKTKGKMGHGMPKPKSMGHKESDEMKHKNQIETASSDLTKKAAQSGTTQETRQNSGGMMKKGHGMSAMAMDGSMNQASPDTAMPKGMKQGKDKMGQSMGSAKMKGHMNNMQTKQMCCGRMGSMMGKPKTLRSVSISADKNTPSDMGHVLHLGERDFYLDLHEELDLSEVQRESLSSLRAQWLLDRESHETDIDAAEDRLWKLTQALPLDQQEVGDAINEVEKLRAAQRLAFINATSKAAQELTPEQTAIAQTLPFQGDM